MAGRSLVDDVRVRPNGTRKETVRSVQDCDHESLMGGRNPASHDAGRVWSRVTRFACCRACATLARRSGDTCRSRWVRLSQSEFATQRYVQP
jgi:hypothetical protein